MEKRIKYHRWPRELNWHQLLLSMREFASRRSLGPYKLHGSAHFWSLPNEVLSLHTEEELDRFLLRHPRFTKGRFSMFFGEWGDPHLKAEFEVDSGYIEVSIRSQSEDLVVATQTHVQQESGLQKAIEIPASRARAFPPQAKAFVGFHFDKAGFEAAEKITDFLTQLRFSVEDAAEFEARAVTEKVRERMDRNEIYVGVVTGSDDHAWLHSEVGYAVAKNMPLILLVHKGEKFNPTIVGREHEYIPFEIAVEQAFIPLLREIRSLGVIGVGV